MGSQTGSLSPAVVLVVVALADSHTSLGSCRPGIAVLCRTGLYESCGCGGARGNGFLGPHPFQELSCSHLVYKLGFQRRFHLIKGLSGFENIQFKTVFTVLLG